MRLLAKSEGAQPSSLSAPTDDEIEEAPEGAEEGKAGDEEEGIAMQTGKPSKETSGQINVGHGRDLPAGEVGFRAAVLAEGIQPFHCLCVRRQVMHYLGEDWLDGDGRTTVPLKLMLCQNALRLFSQISSLARHDRESTAVL